MSLTVSFLLLVGLSATLARDPTLDVCVPELSFASPYFKTGPLCGYSYSDFNVIAFGSFESKTAVDIGGRLLVCNGLNVDDMCLGSSLVDPHVRAGYISNTSMNYVQLKREAEKRNDEPVSIKSKDLLKDEYANPYHYKFFTGVIGGEKMCWKSGTIDPEYAGLFTGKHYWPTKDCLSKEIAFQQKEYCSPNVIPSCICAICDPIEDYFVKFTGYIHARPTETLVYDLPDNGIKFVGFEKYPPTRLIFRVEASKWNAATYVETQYVYPDQEVFIDIVHDKDHKAPPPIYFSAGSTFPHPANKLSYNLAGQGPAVIVETSIGGSILAPARDFSHVEGVSQLGYVVVENVKSFSQAEPLYCKNPYGHEVAYEKQ